MGNRGAGGLVVDRTCTMVRPPVFSLLSPLFSSSTLVHTFIKLRLLMKVSTLNLITITLYADLDSSFGTVEAW